MSLLLRWLMGLIGLQPAVPNNDILGAGDRGLMLRVGVDTDNVPIHALMEGRCEDLEPGDRAIGVVVGVDAGNKPIIAWSKQRCEDETSNLEIGKRYIGLVVGVDDDGVQIIASFCKQECEPMPPPPPDPTIGLLCCDSEIAYRSLCITISGGSAYDGTYSLTYQTGQVIARDVTYGGLPPTCHVTETTQDGWFSEWQDDCRAPDALRHRIWMPKVGDGIAACVVHHSTESPAPTECPDEVQIGTDYGAISLFLPDVDSVVCDPLVVMFSNSTGVPDCSGTPTPIDAILTECE